VREGTQKRGLGGGAAATRRAAARRPLPTPTPQTCPPNLADKTTRGREARGRRARRRCAPRSSGRRASSACANGAARAPRGFGFGGRRRRSKKGGGTILPSPVLVGLSLSLSESPTHLVAQLGEVGRQDRRRHDDVVLAALVDARRGLDDDRARAGGANRSGRGRAHLERLHCWRCGSTVWVGWLRAEEVRFDRGLGKRGWREEGGRADREVEEGSWEVEGNRQPRDSANPAFFGCAHAHGHVLHCVRSTLTARIPRPFPLLAPRVRVDHCAPPKKSTANRLLLARASPLSLDPHSIPNPAVCATRRAMAHLHAHLSSGALAAPRLLR
jgi:hypothetical protein